MFIYLLNNVKYICYICFSKASSGHLQAFDVGSLTSLADSSLSIMTKYTPLFKTGILKVKGKDRNT